MPTFVSIAEAVEQSSYTHEHVTWLVRKGKVKGRKTKNFWLVDLEDLKAYEARMKELGPQKHTPPRIV